MNLFSPLPLLRNPHVQTILGNVLPAAVRLPPSPRRLIALTDGDAIVAHETSSRECHPAKPIAILAHGLGGSHRSAYMIRMTSRLRALGWRAFRLDLRGAGLGMRFARRLYTAGCSDDIAQAVTTVAHAFPGSPIALIGFSLGGNIVLKHTGEAGDSVHPALISVVALAPPIDLVRCSELIAKLPFYDRWYVRHLLQQVAEHSRVRPEIPLMRFPPNLTLLQFDDIYTAPRWGYRDALEYYKDSSALPRISTIRVPTLILTARDDPFVSVAPFEEIGSLPQVQIHIATHGGHLGFLGHDGAGGIRWAETRVIEWLTQRLAVHSVRGDYGGRDLPYSASGI